MSSESDSDAFVNSYNAEIDQKKTKGKRSFKSLQLVKKVVEPRVFSRREEGLLARRLSLETRIRFLNPENIRGRAKVKDPIKTRLNPVVSNEVSSGKGASENEWDGVSESPCEGMKNSNRKSCKDKCKPKGDSVSTEELSVLFSKLNLDENTKGKCIRSKKCNLIGYNICKCQVLSSPPI